MNVFKFLCAISVIVAGVVLAVIAITDGLVSGVTIDLSWHFLAIPSSVFLIACGLFTAEALDDNDEEH